MFYKDPTTGEARPLTEQEQKIFNLCIKALAQQKAPSVKKALEKPDFYYLPHSYNERGASLLDFAITEPNESGIEIARLLVEHGADIYHKDNKGLTIFNTLVGMLNRGQISREIHDGFCRALDLRDSDGNPTTDTLAIMRAIIHEEAVREVEEEWAAKKAAEKATAEDKTDGSDDSFDSAVAEADRYFARSDIIEMHKIMDQIEGKTTIYAVTEIVTGEEARKATESLQHKDKSAKSSQLEFPINDGLSAILDNMFSLKSLDNLIGTKESYALEAGNRGFFKSFGDLVNYLSDNLSYLLNMEIDGSLVEATILQLQGLLTMAGSGGFPMGIPHYNPDDDFEPYFGGGSGAMYLNGGDMPVNFRVVTILGNGTLVITDGAEE